jgi:HK97 family phage portal protein
MGIITRIKSVFSGSEGAYRGPATGIGEFGGMFSIPFGDGFQRNLQMGGGYAARNVPAVYASVMAFSRAVSQCYPAHKQIIDGKHTVSSTSPASRLLLYPNDYQTFDQFIFNVVAQMLFDGECICLIVRDNRSAPVALHICPRGSAAPFIEPETKAIFYSIGANPMVLDESDYMAPARDVIHFRQHTPRHPLIGESPIKAAAMAVGINVALSKTQVAFFENMNRPSGILSTEQALNKEQMLRLREAFDEQSKDWASGKMPILGGGLKFNQLSVDSVDAQLIEAQRMSVEDIARVFGVPQPIIGDLSKATLSNVEQLISMWLSISLGSLLENIERSLDKAFGLTASEYIELDVSALLRTDFMGRVEGLTKGIQGGLFTPNEAREKEGLEPVESGDAPFLQSQMTPINLLKDIAAANLAPKIEPKVSANDPTNQPQGSQKDFDATVAKAMIFESVKKRMQK